MANSSLPLISCVDIFDHFLLNEAWHLREEEYGDKNHNWDYGTSKAGSRANSRYQTSLTLIFNNIGEK